MSIGPWAILITRITPKMRARPSATMAYSVPESRPEITTCPIIAGVMTMFIEQGMGARPSARPCPDAISREVALSADQSGDDRGSKRLPLRPGRRREARLRRRQLVRPDGQLLSLVPLEQHHLVRDLETILVDLV